MSESTPSAPATGARIRRVVTTRAGGRSTGHFRSFNLSRSVGDDPGAVRLNRGRLVVELGLKGAVFLNQVHGTRVTTVETPPRPDATRAPTTAPTELPTIRSAEPRSAPASASPWRTPNSQAPPTSPPAPSTSAVRRVSVMPRV